MVFMEEKDALRLWPMRWHVCACSFALGLAFTAVASAAERKVLGELFVQGNNCSLCVQAAGTLSDMIDQYPDTLAVVEYHVKTEDGSTTGFGNERAAFYDIWSPGLPWFGLDGVEYVGPISGYEQEFQNRASVSTMVTLSLGAELTPEGEWSVTSRVCTEPGGGSLDLDLYLVVVEDHYPAAPAASRNTCRAGFASDTVDLNTNSCYAFNQDIELDASWTPSELKIIAWAQEPTGDPPAVHQSAEQSWPFEPLPALGDWDNDGDADLDDFDGFGTCLSGPGSPAPSQRCLDAFNADQDEDVDVADYAVLQRELSPPSP
jgi:hypothetical protein